MDNNSSKSKLILWIFFSTSLITIFLVSSIISWILAIYWLTDSIQQIWSYVVTILYIVSLWLTPYWIYLLSSNWNSNIESLNDQDIVYSWFWIRLVAYIIDYLLSYLIIPLFFNLYYWFKDWQTIWYKIFWIRVYRIDWDKLSFSNRNTIIFLPIFKTIKCFHIIYLIYYDLIY